MNARCVSFLCPSFNAVHSNVKQIDQIYNLQRNHSCGHNPDLQQMIGWEGSEEIGCPDKSILSVFLTDVYGGAVC